MRVEALAVRPSVGPDRCLTGVSAALAEARKLFREAAPQVSWSEVTAPATALRAQQPMTLLEAIYVVFDRMADGR
jgi:hypothetical protein